MISEKKMQQDIEKYVSQLKLVMKKHPKNKTIKLGNPNDAHLRTYIKNWYWIKLLFPETLDLQLSFDRKKIEKFIADFEKNKSLITKKATNKLNKTPPFVVK